MSSIENATISAFNELIQTIQLEAKRFVPEQFIQFVTFNGSGIVEAIPLQKVNECPTLSHENYRPQASTPLYDAIGFAVSKLALAIQNQQDYSVLVTILTDGEENASKNYTSSDIQRLVRDLEEKGWVFTYLGANQQVDRVAGRMGIRNFNSFKSDECNLVYTLHEYANSRSNFMEKIRTENKVDKDGFFKKPNQ
jgi:hypothetical protein